MPIKISTAAYKEWGWFRFDTRFEGSSSSKKHSCLQTIAIAVDHTDL